MTMIELFQNDMTAVSWWISVALIIIVLAHILEEVFAPYKSSHDGSHQRGFRRFFNLEWFQTGRDDFPVSKFKARFFDQIGLFLVLTLLALLGAFRTAEFILVAVGVVTADLIQHFVFSIVRRQYSPGVATSPLYLVYVLYFSFFELPQLTIGLERILWYMIIGASLLILNYVVASIRVRKWRGAQT